LEPDVISPRGLHAEDDAVVYLDKFPREVALATAIMVEACLAAAWYAKQIVMIERRSRRKVFAITPEDFRWLRKVATMVPLGVLHDDEAMRHIINLLADFPHDKAWWIAHSVTKWAEFYFRLKETPKSASVSVEGVQIRKAAARRLADAGCTMHEIAAITGHASLSEIQRYTKAADQKRLALSAMEKAK
jgi:hypothetical protein